MKRSDIDKFRELATEYVTELHDIMESEPNPTIASKRDELDEIAKAWDEVFDACDDYDEDYVENDDYWGIGDDDISFWIGLNSRCRPTPHGSECIEILAKDVEDWFARHPEFDK